MRNQVFHILRKDIRHHWGEIALSVAIIVAYAWHEVTPSTTTAYALYGFSFLSQTLPLLLVVAWAFLILRALQAECLVGDRQFWVTRPYEWKKLLAAKLLFVLVFVNVPLLILQGFLLLRAGFPLASYISGLLWLQLLWVLILILPVATLATVTASTGQFVLAVLGVVLYLIANSALSRWVPNAGVSGAGSVPAALEGVVLVGASVAAVVWQYARRRTTQSRVLLLAAAVAAGPIIMFATPYRTLIAHTYPRATTGQQLPVKLASDPAKPTSHEGGYPEENKVHVRIPLLVSGVENGSRIHVDGMAESIRANGELQWNSGWHVSALVFLANRQHAQVNVTIGRGFFERVKSIPVKVHISFALAPTHARETIRFVAQASKFTVPGEGRCSLSPIVPDEVLCVFPLKTPFLLVSAKSDEITCVPRQNETALPTGTTLYGGTRGDRGSSPADFGINPVHLVPLSFWDWGEVNVRNYRPRVCSGTPLTLFANWEDSQRFRSELEVDGIRLVDYQLNDSLEGSTGFGVSVP